MSVVAFHYWRYGIGGAERVTYSLMKRFTAAGHTVILLTDVEAEADDLPQPDGVGRYCLPQERGDRNQFLQSFLAESHVDTLIYSSWLSPFAAEDLQVAHDCHVRCIYSVHGASFYYLDKPQASEYFSTMARCATIADGIACLSEVDKLFWKQFNPYVQVVSNPLDYLLEWPSIQEKDSTDLFEVFWSGRLDKVEKRFDLAVEIFSRFLKLRPSAHFTMVAAGGEKEFSELEALIEMYGIEDSVTIIPNVSDLQSYYVRSDAYLLTSPTEGFALSMAEALWSRLPIVCFSLPNISFIHNLESVTQVGWHNIDAAAHALAELYDYDPQRRAMLGELSHSRIEEYCKRDVYQDWEPLLKVKLRQKSSEDDLSLRYTQGIQDAISRILERQQNQETACQNLTNEIACVRHDLKCITSSKSFRLGRALTYPARRLRNLFSRVD